MTTERTTGQAEDVTDARVSRAYRDLAGEYAPASLNERVLRDARAQAGSGYSWWMGWLRPAAWAATVGLCLAIVVELTSTQVADIERLDVPAAVEPAPLDDARDARSAPELPTSRDEFRQQSPARKSEADATATLDASVATPAAQSTEPVESTGRSAAAAEPKVTSDSSILHVSDAPILEEAEEMARMREGPRQEPATNNALRSFAARADAIEPAECDKEARSVPESWIECILDIERRGGDASDEREQLQAAFPDADLP